jgi:hypothetical protein
MPMALLGLRNEDMMVCVMNMKKLSVLWNEEIDVDSDEILT